VWEFHKIYSDEQTQDWVLKGCRSAGIGCLECKQPVIDAVNAELEPIRNRARELDDDPDYVRRVVADGCEAARSEARETMKEVRSVMGLDYR
jgi:tryptophanyl-tRNA synthetase